MEKLEGVEYKQKLTWMYVEKQIDKWTDKKAEK